MFSFKVVSYIFKLEANAMRKNYLTAALFILVVCGSFFLYQCGSDNPSEPNTPDEETVI
jgi:hypothetical protein